jgi:hypothetical protein
LFWEFFEINPGDKTPVLQKKSFDFFKSLRIKQMGGSGIFTFKHPPIESTPYHTIAMSFFICTLKKILGYVIVGMIKQS